MDVSLSRQHFSFENCPNLEVQRCAVQYVILFCTLMSIVNECLGIFHQFCHWSMSGLESLTRSSPSFQVVCMSFLVFSIENVELNFINCILGIVVFSLLWSAVTVTILTLEPRTHHLLCKLIWWLGGWHNLSRPETLLGLTDRASWGRGRRACPTVLWKTQREAARLHRQTVQNNNAGVVRSNQTELDK